MIYVNNFLCAGITWIELLWMSIVYLEYGVCESLYCFVLIAVVRDYTVDDHTSNLLLFYCFYEKSNLSTGVVSSHPDPCKMNPIYMYIFFSLLDAGFVALN